LKLKCWVNYDFLFLNRKKQYVLHSIDKNRRKPEFKWNLEPFPCIPDVWNMPYKNLGIWFQKCIRKDRYWTLFSNIRYSLSLKLIIWRVVFVFVVYGRTRKYIFWRELFRKCIRYSWLTLYIGLVRTRLIKTKTWWKNGLATFLRVSVVVRCTLLSSATTCGMNVK